MSRIFEALQRSESERTGEAFPLPSGIPAELIPSSAVVESEREDAPLAAPKESVTLQVSVSPECRLVSLTNKESLGAEKFRFLAVRLRQMRAARALKKLLITSTIAEEGKSLVSANLATTLARKQHQKVLLIDGDLRRPVLAQQFGLGKLAGISEWLRDDSRQIANIYHLEGPGFWFMPAGHPPENPLELMQSGRLSVLFEQLTADFDWIIIDSPPVLPLADTSVWTRLVDGVLLVAREGKTERKELQRGLKALEQANLLGVVLNSCSSADHGNYYQRYGAVASPRNGNGGVASE